ncbi:phage baseplate protein [Sporohalobacter salinus]|uniref:phage baseplate protein n=1 Tax=Sporohalobacter salinus TaxID=1494606 RepID=UPI00195F3958|nr:hypothetical protein [Sporohalobacter salinus]MBM7623644.1 hypothetical protein [Sporohalobacter salinus]
MKSNATLGSKSLFVTDESFDFQNKVTDKPIEGDQSISDHLENQPVQISLSIVVTENGRSEADELRKLRDSKQVYDYHSVDGKTYENMAIKSLSIPKNADIKDGFSGSINLQQVQIIEQETQEISLGEDSVTGVQAQKKNEKTPQRTAQAETTDENTATGYHGVVGDNNAS